MHKRKSQVLRKEQMGSIQKVTIAFGLVSIPVRITAAARAEHVAFNMLHTDCLHRINMKTFCPICDREISRVDTVKGIEVEPDCFTVISDEEFKDITPKSSRVLDITSTTELNSIDPLLYETSYFLEPEPAGLRGYKLLLTALEREKKAAIGQITMHQREQTVVIRPYHGVLVFHTMYFSDEIRPSPGVDLSAVEVKKEELDLARKLVNIHAAPFVHSAYHDGYREELTKLIAAKRNVVIGKGKATAKVASMPDIMDVMRASIAKKKTA